MINNQSNYKALSKPYSESAQAINDALKAINNVPDKSSSTATPEINTTKTSDQTIPPTQIVDKNTRNVRDSSHSAAIPKINITTEQSNITDSTSNQMISATKATGENTNNDPTNSFFNKKTLAIGIIGLVVGSLLAALTIFVPPIALFLGVALGKTTATLIILGSGTLGGLIFTAVAGLTERNKDTNKKTLTQQPTENKKSTQNAALASLKSTVAPTATNDNKNTVPAVPANASVSSCKAILLSNEVSVSSNITAHENKKSLVI